MAKEKLSQKEQHYADSREEAEQIVTDAKESAYLTMHKITGKHNKFGPYFLVDLTYTYNTPKEIMEDGESSNVPDGQLNIDDVHDGIAYTIDPDGSVTVQNDDDENYDDVQFERPSDEITEDPFKNPSSDEPW